MKALAPGFAMAMLVAPTGRALTAPSDRVRAMRREVDRLAAFGFSGLVLIAEHGMIVLEESRGLADAARGIPVTRAARAPK
jgi:copper homeostasis protein CutC